MEAESYEATSESLVIHFSSSFALIYARILDWKDKSGQLTCLFLNLDIILDLSIVCIRKLLMFDTYSFVAVNLECYHLVFKT